MTTGAPPLWSSVRRAILDLQWSERRTHDLLGEWQQTLTELLAVRRAAGPVPGDDPVALAASAAAAARRVEPAPVEATSLESVQAALAVVAHTAARWPDDQRAGLADPSLRAAYELAHWVRIRHPSEAVRQWLSVGESALDQALYAPAPRSATRLALARWQAALADVHALQDNPVVQRGVALAHALVLEAAERALGAAAASAGLPETLVQNLQDGLAQVRSGHHATLSDLASLRAEVTPANRAIMLRLGEALVPLTRPTSPADPPPVALDAFLRSGFGQVTLALQVTGAEGTPRVSAAAAMLEEIGRQHQYRPHALQLDTDPTPRRPATPDPVATPVVAPETAPVPTAMPARTFTGRIEPGAALDLAQLHALCRDRDLGRAAATADPTAPPAALAGIPAARWPALIDDGRQAIADLVTAVTPMVYALLRGRSGVDDLRGEMFLHLVDAARTFDPQRHPDRNMWPAYAWRVLQNTRDRGVDDAGQVRSRSKTRPHAVLPLLDEIDPVDPRATATDSRLAVTELADAVAALPPSLRQALLESMAEGATDAATAERLSVSRSTARHRITQARELIAERVGYQPRRGPGIGR